MQGLSSEFEAAHPATDVAVTYGSSGTFVQQIANGAPFDLYLSADLGYVEELVDVGAVVRQVELDRGRPVNLVRIGMVVDALARYLIDDGAMLYGVIERSLLSEQAFTSKERMVLGRWADDGLIEVTAGVTDRAHDVAAGSADRALEVGERRP
jgi:molybdenum ABC transporter molybdate-binding protein